MSGIAAKAPGWAVPELVISPPRLQKADGFHYLYAEVKHVHESEVGGAVGTCFGRIFPAWEHAFGKAASAPTLAFFINVPGEEKWYDVRMGFAVPEATEPYGETKVRYVPPTLVAGILAWGSLDKVPQSYKPLMDFMDANGYKPVEGWREWYLYFESDASSNNITWVEHMVEEV
jgi:hypothetical protein